MAVTGGGPPKEIEAVVDVLATTARNTVVNIGVQEGLLNAEFENMDMLNSGPNCWAKLIIYLGMRDPSAHRHTTMCNCCWQRLSAGK